MAVTPPSTQQTYQTHQRSLDIQLNAALLEFAPRYMKDQLEHLAHECDQRLERDLLPQLRAILHDIDHERDIFQIDRNIAAHNLRSRLELLRFDTAAIDDAVRQLDAVTPRLFRLLPRASSLESSLATPASLSTLGSAPLPESAFDTPGKIPDSQVATIPLPTQENPSCSTQGLTTQIGHQASPGGVPSLDDQAQAQAEAAAEATTLVCSSKRPKDDLPRERDISPKRQKLSDEKIPISTQLDAALSTSSSRYVPKAKDTEGSSLRGHRRIDDDSSPDSKPREPRHGPQPNHEEKQERPRRTTRNLRRPDYAEIVGNKGHLKVETESNSTGIDASGRTTSTKRRVTKPGVGSKARTAAESKKPFGYMSEPWPRRSAPR